MSKKNPFDLSEDEFGDIDMSQNPNTDQVSSKKKDRKSESNPENKAGQAQEQISNSVLSTATKSLKYSFLLSFISKYFDVEFDEIKSKLIYSMIPFSRSFYPLVENKPDLYGPFWIYSTLIILVAIVANLSAYIDVSDI